MSTNDKQLGTLQRLRAERGKGQRQLALEAGVNRTTLMLIETGQRKAQLTTLGKLAAALEVDVQDLLEYLDTSASERGRMGQAAKRRKGKA